MVPPVELFYLLQTHDKPSLYPVLSALEEFLVLSDQPNEICNGEFVERIGSRKNRREVDVVRLVGLLVGAAQLQKMP